MAGLGIGPGEFALLRINDPEERTVAIESRLTPALARVGSDLVDGLSRIACAPLVVQSGRPTRRRGKAPEEAFVAFSEGEKGYRAVPYLALTMTRSQLHARVAARSAADREGAMRRTLEREAASLAKKGKPFRKLRNYADWDYEELPEIAPAHSAAFWSELAEAPPGTHEHPNCLIDVGVAFSSEEARSLSIGDLLGAFRDLAPLYKLLVNAR
jgi:uncharacterized protein YktB (UPF0637 family)